MWNPTHIQVTVQRARNLQNKGRKGTNDAFVLIQMGKEKFQTTVQEKTTDPEWYEECDLTLIGRDSDVSLTVFHRNVLGLDEFLGQTSVSLRGIESFDRSITKWYTLKGKSEHSSEKNRGELEVRISFIVRRCSDTQSLNDLSFKGKKKHSLKHLAASVGHKIQKLPSRSVSLRNLDPRKRLSQLKEKRHYRPEDNTFEFDGTEEEFKQMTMNRNSALYSSTLSLPQSAMILEEAEEETPRTLEESGDMSDSSNSVEGISKPPLKRTFTGLDTKPLNHGEWTNRVLSHSKESQIARSEANLIEALRSESPIVPVRKNKFETLRLNLRRHTLQLSESPEISPLALTNLQKKKNLENLKPESPKNNKPMILQGIPSEVIQQYEKMNHKDLVLLAIKQQVELEKQRDKVSDLENYLDNLLVRVMETTPRILQKPYVSATCLR